MKPEIIWKGDLREKLPVVGAKESNYRLVENSSGLYILEEFGGRNAMGEDIWILVMDPNLHSEAVLKALREARGRLSRKPKELRTVYITTLEKGKPPYCIDLPYNFDTVYLQIENTGATQTLELPDDYVANNSLNLSAELVERLFMELVGMNITDSGDIVTVLCSVKKSK